jgi:hypothetical protein
MKKVLQATKITAHAMKAIIEYWILHQKNKNML